MPPYLDLTDDQFQRIVSAFSTFHLGPDRPPWFRHFLVFRLRASDPGLVGRLASATDEQVEHLFTRLRAYQLTD